MKLLTNPIVLMVAALIFFVGGFGGGLYMIGYFDPATYATPKKDVEKHLKKELAKKIEHEKGELDWMQKLTLEMDRLGKDLNERKLQLDKRESDLMEKEIKLQKEKQSLADIEKHIETMKADLEAQISLVETTQEGNLQRLSKLYSAMDISNAAKMIAGMTDVQAFQVLSLMKEAKSAKILEAWLAQPENADKAKRVSELIRLNQPARTEG